jgi:dTDP-4-amino-4,6-dideoxy-D-galactose acyltransferase
LSYELLRWDSQFFGFPIGRVIAGVDAEAIAGTVARADADGIQCLYHLVSADDVEALHAALAHGFSPYDVRIQFDRALAPPAPREVPVKIRKAVPADEAVLLRLASETITATRFTVDHHFPRDRISHLYAAWVKRGLESGDARRVLLAHPAAGFVVCGIDSQNCAGEIELVAVAPGLEGHTIGQALLDEAHRIMMEAGCNETRVVTQGRNVAAQRLYQRLGYRTRTVAWWLHRWR